MKRIFTLVLSVVLLMGVFTGKEVKASDVREYTNATEIYEICQLGYNGGELGPIVITKGTIEKDGVISDVYLIALSGTELLFNQSTDILTDLMVGFNQDNAYLKNAVSAIVNNIPYGSNLILAGHSLGGMVAQQVAGHDQIKSLYNVMNTVTFGSPLISEGKREGTVKRLGDSSDIVPYLSVTGHLVWQVAGLNRENGGYGTDVSTAHTESYSRVDLWGKYDVTGTKFGTAKLTLDLSTQSFYQSPYIKY